MNKPKYYIVSKCCHDKIKAYIPRGSMYRTNPCDPVPYCDNCGAANPEEVEVDENGEVIDDDDA